MVLEYTGDKGEPQAIASGAAPTFASDISELATWLMAGHAFRRFATYATLAAATGVEANDVALADDVPGALWRYDGTAGWQMHGTARFAGATARDNVLTSPAQGMRARLDDVGYVTEYFDTYDASTNPGGAPSAGWYWVSGPSPAGFALKGSKSIGNGGSATVLDSYSSKEFATHGFSESSGVFTAAVAGRYRLTLGGRYSTAASGQYGWLEIHKNGSEHLRVDTAGGGNSSAVMGGSMTAEVQLAVSDTVSFYARQVSGGANTFNYELTADYLGKPHGTT